MSMLHDLYNKLDAPDIDAIERLCHDDSVFVDDYEMMAREDWIGMYRKLWSEGGAPDFSGDRRMLLDAPDCLALEYTRDVDGVPHRIINISQLKDGKFWRSQIHRVPI